MVQQCESNGNERYNMDDAASYAAARKKGINVDYFQSLVNECELYNSFIKQYDQSPFAVR